MLTLIALVAFAVIDLAAVLFLLTHCLVAQVRGKTYDRQLTRLKKATLSLAVATIVGLVFVTVGQLCAFTPRIDSANGIAELRQLELNGRRQWISLRGRDKTKPVLLFLAGGPGGSQMAAVRHELAELEEHFVVVNWDQPGSGKSYDAEKARHITVDTYVEDGHALTEYLRERFSQEKIFLIGESWGSALGVFLVDRYPECYRALIGTGQMVDFAETERIDYAKAMEIAENNGDTLTMRRLTANGEPPYYGRNMVWKSAVYLNYLSEYMSTKPDIRNPGYSTLRDIGSSEYGPLDKINYLRGIIYTFNRVYQQLYDIDLRTDCAELDVPVYFFLGRHDVNAPTVLVEQYVEVLKAPEKGVVWFEHSGHSPWINETDKFVREVLSCLLNNSPK